MEKGTSEITKLTERLSKDPKSKLFVPLAEEYKKAGDIERAIAVLTEGLKNNPGYVTAKSFLGRLLLDKGNLSEAQKEFEEVIKTIPDNVLAQRKLGDIHVLQGRAQEALLFFKAVLTVNPKDPELKALIADIEAGRDVRDRISGPRPQPATATGITAAAVLTPGAPPSAPSIPAGKPSSVPVIPLPPKPQAAPVGVLPALDAEEPEEVLVFESLDEAAPAAALQRPESTQDILELFAEPVSEKMHEDTDIPMADSGVFDAVAVPEASAPVTEPALSTPDAGLVNSFFDSEPAAPTMDISAASEGLAPVTEPELGLPSVGLSGSAFFDSEPLPVESQNNMYAGDTADEPVLEVSGGELTETAPADDLASEALFFEVEPVEHEEEPRTSRGPGAADDVPAPGQDRFVHEEAFSGGGLFDVEPIEEARPSAHVSDSGLDVAADDEAVLFKETLPEADDFTTDTLAELYIAQGFYEKAIEIYERMLADRPNSKLLKDKLANVRAMGSASSADEEQGTPVFFEAPGAPPVPSSQSLPAGVAKQWKAPGGEAEAREYIPSPPDDFESTAFGSGFAPVEYVQPEAPDALPPFPAEQTLPDEKQVPATSKTAASGREQTIARLDTWLKNIKKEK